MNISQLLTKLKTLVYSKTETDSLLGGKASSSHTHTKSEITDFPTIPSKTSQLTNDSGFITGISWDNVSGKPSTFAPSSHTHGNITNAGAIGSTANKPLITTTNGVITTGSFGTTANTFCQGNDSRLSDARTPTSHTHTKSQITDFPTLATVATSGSYNDLSNKPTSMTPTSHTHTKSQITDFPTIPSKTSQLTNDSGFLTSHQSLSNYSTLANTVKSLSISGNTITVTPGSGSAYTLTTQDTTYSHPTTSGNKHIPSGGSSGQFLGWSADGTAKWVNNPNTNTWTAMVGATSSANGSVGYVNAVPPKDGYNTKYLRADGTWQVPPDHTYTVNNATLTIQKNGTTVKTFTANASSNVTCNITVPTNNNELTNGSGFITSAIKEGSIGGSSGWCLLYGDLLIQYGTEASSAQGYDITFSKPYADRPSVVMNYGDDVGYSTPCCVNESYKTYFTVRQATQSGAWRCNWIAIGKKGY